MNTDEKRKPDQFVFFKEVMENIVSYGGEYNDFELLTEICNTFSMDAGFVYLKDPAKGGAFYKKFQTGFADGLSDAIDLQLPSTCEQAAATYTACSGMFVEPHLAKLWGVSRLAVLPVFEKSRIIGFVGVLSRNSSGAESETDKNALSLALTLIVGNVRAEYYKQQQNYARDSLAKAIDNTGVDIYVTDFYTNEILYVNKSMALPYGGAEAMIGKKCYLTLYENRRAECEFCPKYKLIDEKGNPTKLYSWDYERPFDGAWFRVFSAAFKWEEDRLAHVITSTDITENKRNEFLVEKMALFDALTDIPNRRSFERIFQRVIDKAVSEDSPGYVLFIDLDNFKHINDAFGHEKGDELLIGVAAYLDGLTDEAKKVFRYGGDEFIFVVEDASRETISALTESMLERFAQPWLLRELEYFCTASIGVAQFPRDGITYDSLLHAADSAMYNAKRKGKAAISFSTAESVPRLAELEMEFALRRAILEDCKDFSLFYHPVVDAETGTWIGGEALLRWNSPQFGMVYPDRFISVCERLGLISQLSRWALRRALEYAKSWQAEALDDFCVSLNMSALDLQQEDFVDYLKVLFEEYDYPPAGLMIELTVSEVSVPKFDMEQMRKKVDSLRELGVRVALDGCGLGEMSLERIKDLKVDITKIDKKFVLDFLEDELKMAFVKAIIMLSHAAHAKVCAEGVRSEAHALRLKEFGCDFLQGVYYLEPASEEDFRKALFAERFSEK